MAPSLLLDTHTLLWWLAEPETLSKPAQAAIGDRAATVFVSAASSWELATKVRLGIFPGAEGLLQDLPSLLQQQGFQPMAAQGVTASTPVASRRPTGIPSIGFWRPRLNWRACTW
jgi:PIN domain nuclease of toxin-antitoxin system